MALFIFLLIVLVIGLGLIATAIFMKKPAKDRGRYDSVVYRWPFALAGAVCVFGACLGILVSSLTTIGTSDTGIVTAFGHTEGDLTPGIHWVAPWQGVTVWDGSVQHTVFQGTHNAKDNTGCLVVRIAGQQQACLDVNIWWSDFRPGSDAQFVRYRTFPRLQAAYMSRGVLVQYFNNVFERFDPVQLTTQQAQGKTGGSDVSDLTRQVAASLRAAYKGQVNIIRVTTSSPSYSSEVETALNRIVTAKAQTNIAAQNEQTAKDQAAANNSLSASKVTPATIEQNCLNITQSIIQAGGQLPQAWTCTGSSAGVIVGAGK